MKSITQTWRRSLAAFALMTMLNSGEHGLVAQDSGHSSATTWPSPDVRAIQNKLEQITLEEVNFEGLPLKEVVEYLAQQSRRYDPDKRGINFLISNRPASPITGPGDTANLPEETQRRIRALEQIVAEREQLVRAAEARVAKLRRDLPEVGPVDMNYSATVKAVRGKAEYIEGGMSKPLTVGTVLHQGAIVKTAANSEVDFILEKLRQIVRITGEATVVLDEIFFQDTSGETVVETRPNLNKGRILRNVLKRAPEPWSGEADDVPPGLGLPASLDLEGVRRLDEARVTALVDYRQTQELIEQLKPLKPSAFSAALPPSARDRLLDLLLARQARCQQELADLQGQGLGEGNPKCQRLEAQLEQLEAQIKDRVRGILLGLQARVAAL